MSIASSISLDSTQDLAAARERQTASIRVIAGMIALATVTFFVMSWARHYVLRSGAFDLGFFDQAVWLISQGETPISSLRDFHALADHASFILYPLALLYKIWADPKMLLLAQAFVLAMGAWPVFRLARGAGLTEHQSYAMAGAYLMYPFVLTANLFDFHPETLAMPALLMAILAARENRRISFCIWIALVLACKEVLALTVIAMGLWLLLFERRRFHGSIALAAGTLWFIFALRVVIPYFGDGRNPSGMNYYGYLGSSMSQIIWTMIVRPDIVLGRCLSADGLKYIVLLVAPAIWGLHYKTVAPLIVCLPTIVLNLLSEIPAQRSPFYQYSVPMVPFFFMAIILAVGTRSAWIQRPRFITTWAVSLLAVGVIVRMVRAQDGQSIDFHSLAEVRAAIKQVPPTGPVLTTFELLPHLSRRPLIHYIGGHRISEHLPLEEYGAVLLSFDHQSMAYYESWASQTVEVLRHNPDFSVAYEGDDVVLFVRSMTDPTEWAQSDDD